MHENSVESNQKVDHETRRCEILGIFDEADGPLTDREVMKALGYTERNATAPDITGLIDAGLLIEVGKKFDEETEREVRACILRVKGTVVQTNVSASMFVLLKDGTWTRYSACIAVEGIARDSKVLDGLVDHRKACGVTGRVVRFVLEQWQPSTTQVKPAAPPPSMFAGKTQLTVEGLF